MIKAKLLLAAYLLTVGWGSAPPPGVITGKAWSPRECHTCWPVNEIDCLPLHQPVCFDNRYWLYTTPSGFPVDVATWQRYELGDGYP